MKNNFTKKFINNIKNIALKTPSANDINQVKRCLLDYLGSTLAGARLLRSKTIKLNKLIDEKGSLSPIGIKI